MVGKKKRVKAMGGGKMGKRVKAMGGKKVGMGKRVKAMGGNKIKKLAGGGAAEKGMGLLAVLMAAAAKRKGKPLTSGEKAKIKIKADKDT